MTAAHSEAHEPTPSISSFTRDGLTFEVTDRPATSSTDLPGAPAPVVLLLHGFPTDRTAWESIAALLNARGLRTIAPDQRGYSKGARPKPVAAYRMEEMVADALALADLASPDRPVHVVGHDWGAIIAWLLAGNHPDRVASLTALSVPHPGAVKRSYRTLGQLAKSWYILGAQLPGLPERILSRQFRQMIGRSGLHDPELTTYAHRFNTAESLRGPINWYRAMPRSRVRAPRVSTPTTFIWGNQDTAIGAEGPRLCAEHVTGEYRFVELDAGHWLPEQEAERCAAEIIQRIESTIRKNESPEVVPPS